MLLALLACDPETAPKVTAPSWCEGPVQGRYELEAPTSLDVFPDETWSTDDPTTATGRRLQLGAASGAFPDNYADLARQLETLDGFGLSAPIYFRFDGALDAGVVADVRVLALTDAGPVPWTVDVAFLDAGATLVLTPRTPFPAATPMVAALLTLPSETTCVSPAPALRDKLWSAGADPDPLADRYAEALDALGVGPERIGALTIFTTQSLAADAAILASIAATDPVFASGTCADHDAWRYCQGTVPTQDYRDATRVVPDDSGQAWSSYDLPVGVWLPLDGGPFPVAMCGHGLGGDRFDCDFLADLVAPLGIAVVGVDAQEHGDHPARSVEGSELESTLALFGVSLVPALALDALVLRDNFRASNWDRLQVLRAVHTGLDADGDGVIDLDASHLTYAGVSLGGIMGPQLLAGDPTVTAGALVVPGGSLFSIVTESPSLSVLADVMKPASFSDDDVSRTVMMLQVLVDAGDPLVHAGLLAERRAGEGGPHLLEMVAVEDQIVPNISSARLAQALELPGVGTEYLNIPGITFTPGDVSENLEDGRTGGLVLCAVTQPYEGADLEAADHSYLHESVQGIAAIEAFLVPALTEGVPVVPDVCGG